VAQAQVARYGSWKSPITSDVIVSETVRLSEVVLDGADVYWIESRPAEGGRAVIVRRAADGPILDVTPSGFNVRTRAHEYGGGSFAVAGGTVVFSNFDDQRLYRQDAGSDPRPITPEANLRYADGIIDGAHQCMFWVREDHRDSGREPSNSLVRLSLDGSGSGQVVVSGNDFYSSPHLSPDGSRLAWLTWNHPNMPWDGTELWVGELAPDGSVARSRRVAGGEAVSIFQPQWSPDGILYFVSDRTGWWNLYRWRDGEEEPLWEIDAEFGRPQWQFGMSTYAFASAARLICAYNERGTWRLASIDVTRGTIEKIEVPYTSIRCLRATADWAVFIGSSPTESDSVVQLDLKSGRWEVLARSASVTVDPAYLSTPETIAFPTEHGLTAYGFFYPPKNRDYAGPPSERPPLLLISHGGPTSATSSSLDLTVQYWTSRGFAVLDVNYGGSTGYGREYRQRLEGQWGIVDVDDCVNGARYLVERGKVDGERLIIRGGSAGGYTTLAALTFRDVFRAGASYYGISDLEALTRETHKFESRYLDRLIGPYPERRDLYVQRSPIHFVERLSCPIIVFQGLEDKVVPPNQAELIVEALRAKGLPVAYVTFEGEGHGFRRAESIKRSLDAELYFYSRVFGFELADPVEPVPIENI